MRTWILLASLLCAVSAVGGNLSTEPSSKSLDRIIASSPRPSPFHEFSLERAAAKCCKVCTKGKPCGDTCIAQDKTCHVGPGCAC
jgi:hypothetical protein